MTYNIGVQLYSVRKSFPKDLDGTLARVREMGYEYVEFAGVAPYSAAELRNALERNDLKCAGFHMPHNLLRGDEDSFKKAVEYIKTTGGAYGVMPGLPKECYESAYNITEEAKALSEVAYKLQELDILTGYHNHAIEFKTLDNGDNCWNILQNNTPDFFMMQCDTGNALGAGADAAELVKAISKTQNSIHFKPYHSTKGFAPTLGDDDTDYAALLKLYTAKQGLHPVIIEYEDESLYDEMTGIKRCLEGLKKI